ncbi:MULTISPECIES: universal stress protein [unclassified Nocardia]|uniref:universal stress protein n=1 Tax=unclassified Nocardia TaxID=2637762 RepID=UPI001CE4132C|nr:MULTISPECIES: universal stress protein [unclassified Nocardia]
MSASINPPVLVGSDGSDPALAAVRWAAGEAVMHRAPLTILHCIGAPIDFGPGIAFSRFDYEVYRQAGIAALEQSRAAAAEAIRSAGELEITTELLEAPPIPVLRDRSKDARLLVVGTQGLGAFRRALLGSVSTALARHAECPVAIVPESPKYDTRDQRVVVGVDGSACSARAIEIAFDEAAFRGAALTAVLAWTEFPPYIPREDMRQEAEAILAESLAGYGERYPEVAVRRMVAADRPAKVLLELGSGAQLVVVGSHGRGGFAGMTLGSVSQAVLHATTAPLIIARSHA